MQKVLFSLLLTLVSFPIIVSAQSVANGNLNSWFLVVNRLHLSDKFAITNELHERTGSFLKDEATIIIRPSIDYTLNENVDLSAGYSFVRSWPYAPYSQPIARNEHNVWEQVMLKFKTGKVHILNRIRFEHRFIQNINYHTPSGDYILNGTSFANRFRFRFNLSFDLFKVNKGKNTIFVNAFDEIWLNQANNLMPRSFARNWLYTGLGYKFNNTFNVQLAHMHQYDKTGQSSYISSSIIQLSLFKSFSLH